VRHSEGISDGGTWRDLCKLQLKNSFPWRASDLKDLFTGNVVNISTQFLKANKKGNWEKTSTPWGQRNWKQIATIGCKVDVVAAWCSQKKDSNQHFILIILLWKWEGLNALIGLCKDWALSLYSSLHCALLISLDTSEVLSLF